MKITQDQFNCYLAVQETGYYNMLDSRARALSNEMNDVQISREEWTYIISSYSSLQQKTEINTNLMNIIKIK